MANHLSGASSPYLLQHAGNPVDWRPWSPAALELARSADKPIFLSIGYAACHWCHVMAHESFEDPVTATFMNAHFVNIKVDREERPDLDSIYMSFVVSVTGQGGWPMSVFLTPAGKPFYGGTYFPPEPRHNLPGFRQVLQAIARLWQEDRDHLLAGTEELSARLQTQVAEVATHAGLDTDLLGRVIQSLAESYDWQHGGWGSAPKFPQPMLVEFLLRQSIRGDHTSLDIAGHALRSMAQGGMYDVLGGGFARYSVDPTWLIPHFEKMLYDNAQLALVYLHAFQLTGSSFFREVCESTLDFILRELTHPAGGFFSSLDADSEGEEGKYYLWTVGEIRSALPDSSSADLFMHAYGMTETGNFEGSNILRRQLTIEQLAHQFHLPPEEVQDKLVELRKHLLDVRSTRLRPATDDKVLVSWNALALAAFAEAGRALGRADYLQAAARNADFLLEHLMVNGRLMRSWREGVANHNAYLEDYASLALALLSLYQADHSPRWFQASLALNGEILSHFKDPAVGFFDTRDDHETLLYRPKDLQDNAIPSGNALAAGLLLHLATLEGSSTWRTFAEAMLSSMLGMLERYPSAFGHWLCAADFSIGPVAEVAILGDLDHPSTRSLLQPLLTGYHPRVLLAASPYPPPPGSPALLSDRLLVGGMPTAYVCQNFICHLPVHTAADIQNLLP